MYYSSMNDMAANPTRPGTSTALFSVLHAAHTLENKLETALGRVGLSMAKFSVLTELVNAGNPLTLGDLAARVSCVRSNMTQLIDRLEADGFVRRVQCPTDRRSVHAQITESGRSSQADAAAELEKLDAEFAAVVREEDRVAIDRLARAMG
ncbi:MAG TPA: MarR family transcriptional regulator [Gemmatimonadaceae bacterium]|nr:MarR family transcriptional regulator [Gemmatimonadaceae bacterium]